MLKNYFKIAWRNLLRSKISSFINVGGLAAGMAVAILIGLWIYDELSFNKNFDNYSQVAKVLTRWESAPHVGTSQPMPLGTELRSVYTEQFKLVVLSTGTESHILAAGDKKFKESGKFMQPEAMEMFSLKMLKGTWSGLKDLSSIVISESLAKKLFGEADPMDKSLTIDNRLSVTITGVYKDFPRNSEFNNLTYFAPWDLYLSSNDWVEKKRNNWNNTWVHIYTQLAPGTDFDVASARIKDIKRAHVSQEEAEAKPAVFLQPMSKWHLYSSFGMGGIPVRSERLEAIWFYAIIGLFVLLLACINFMNLSTSRSEKRAREVGVRKAIGSMRTQLIVQFFCESLLVAAIAFIIAIALAWLALPWFNNIADKNISMPWLNTAFWLSGIAFSIFTGLLAGSYPALYLSSFNAVKVLKGTFSAGSFTTLPRKVLVVTQFTVSITLMIGTIVVYKQVQFAKSRPVGYSREGLIAIPMATEEFQGKYDLLKSELKNTGAVEETAESASSITSIESENGGFNWKGKDPSLKDQFGTLSVTHEYGKTVGWKFISGRDFSNNYSSDSSGFVINAAAAKYIGLKNAVNETLTWDRYPGKNFKILGVIEDMVMNSPYQAASPTIFFLSPDDSKNWIFLRIEASVSIASALPKIERVFKTLIPSVPFDYKFVDTEYAAKFSSEERTARLAGFFSGLTILISCLGLFGLTTFVTEKRTKEIGIRKILGASAINLWQMLSKDFLVLVIISCLIALPAAAYFMDGWLQNYEYRTSLSWWIFGSVSLGSLMIALITVSFQAIKAAISNPIKSLRAE